MPICAEHGRPIPAAFALKFSELLKVALGYSDDFHASFLIYPLRARILPRRGTCTALLLALRTPCCYYGLVTAIGHVYDENGVMHLTAKLADFLPPHTRRFSRPAQMYEELMNIRSVPPNRALELCSAGKLAPLEGDTKDWARVVLCGPDEPAFAARFAVFHELQGPVLDYCLAGPFMPATFCSNHGVRYESVEQLVEALDCVGLPGKEIRSFTDKVYSVTGPQLRVLRLGMPNN